MKNILKILLIFFLIGAVIPVACAAESMGSKDVASSFTAIGAIIGVSLIIGAAMITYTAAANRDSHTAFKQMKEIGYGVIFLIIFLLAVVMMGAAVYR